MRMYHNNIKSELIDYYCSDATVLDLGFGKGGDLGKYQRANVTELWGIEPDHMNLNECRHRLEQKIFSNIRRRTHLIKARAQDTNLIAKEVGKKVDTVASFFSLSFFFFTEKDLDQLVDTIDATLNVHGFFIGTTIIGEHVRRLLLEHDGKFSFKDGFIMWDDDQEKRVRLSFPGTIVGNQIESLVNFPLLVEKLEQKDINLMAVTDFPPSEYLSEEENTLNSLYAQFVFRRVKPRISAIVVTKLSKNMSSIIQERDFKSMTFKVRDVEDLRKQINRFYNIYNEYTIETEEGFTLTDSDILDSISTKEGINILKVVLIKTSTIDVTFRGQSHTFTVGSLAELKFQVKKHYLISRNFKILNESGSITKDADIIRGYIHVTVKEE
jgi:mRNA (guanine-N7-)-methyltransferase